MMVASTIQPELPECQWCCEHHPVNLSYVWLVTGVWWDGEWKEMCEWILLECRGSKPLPTFEILSRVTNIFIEEINIAQELQCSDFVLPRLATASAATKYRRRNNDGNALLMATEHPHRFMFIATRKPLSGE
eukprot:4895300-Pyramimonas_sp.AAC.2